VFYRLSHRFCAFMGGLRRKRKSRDPKITAQSLTARWH